LRYVPDIVEAPNGFKVEIPAKCRTSAIVFSLGFALFAALWGYFFVRQGSNTNTRIGASFSTALALFALLQLYSELWGRELIELDGCLLKVSEIWWGFKTSRRFDITMISHMRVGAANYWVGTTYVLSEGRIQFEYEGKMVSIGGTVGENEAFDIVERVLQKQATPDQS
jgi:hypothetical protein